MSAQPSLKLVEPPVRSDDAAIPLERRAYRRHTISGRVTAVQTAQTTEPTACRNRICSLELRNISDTGLGAVAGEPIQVNTAITVFLPPHGAEQGSDLYGRVIRCTARDHGHDVGIRFETPQKHHAA